MGGYERGRGVQSYSLNLPFFKNELMVYSSSVASSRFSRQQKPHRVLPYGSITSAVFAPKPPLHKNTRICFRQAIGAGECGGCCRNRERRLHLEDLQTGGRELSQQHPERQAATTVLVGLVQVDVLNQRKNMIVLVMGGARMS